MKTPLERKIKRLMRLLAEATGKDREEIVRSILEASEKLKALHGGDKK
jgi:hypothetical protein